MLRSARNLPFVVVVTWFTLGTACSRPIKDPEPAQRQSELKIEQEKIETEWQGPATVGVGRIEEPALGPAPREFKRVGGEPFVLVKNWDFGAGGSSTVRNVNDLINEFEFHDQWGTIANGTHYGSVIVAPNEATAIYADAKLNLPNNRQPIEDPARPNREWTSNSLKAHVRPLTATQVSASTMEHNAGCGSLIAKFRLPNGGSHLQRDLLWETRVRMPVPKLGYWYAVWAAGTQWNLGAEMDVMEAFGAPHLMEAKVFHTATVGGEDAVNYDDWFRGLRSVGVPEDNWDLTRYHVWTWVYKRDDTYQVYYDGKQIQHGKLIWTLGAKPDGKPIDMAFLFDFAWGHTETGGCQASLPASAFPITYEIDYSRVYLR